MPSLNFPALRGNWIDLVILLCIAYYVNLNWGRGIFLGLLQLCGFVLAFAASLQFYGFFGNLLIKNFTLSQSIANAIGFLIAGVVAEAIFYKIIDFYYDKLHWRFREIIRKQLLLYQVNRLLGILPTITEGIIIIAFILTLIVALPLPGWLKKDILSSKIGAPLVSQSQGVEKTIRNIFAPAVSDTLTFLTVTANPRALDNVDLRFTQPEGRIDEVAEAKMLELVNRERTQARLSGLSVSISLRDLSRAYGQDMFARGYFSHYNPEGQSPFDRMNNLGIGYQTAGENLALAPNVELAHQGLMNSAGHRANILNPNFGKVGIGVIDGGIYGEMFVQEFTD